MMYGPALKPISPSKKHLKTMSRLWRLLAPLIRLVLRRWLKEVKVTGLEHLSGGPYLMLMQHTTRLDPLILTSYVNQPIRFMVTEPVMFPSIKATMLNWSGQVSKRKLMPDTLPMRTLKAWAKQGSSICLFPEGQFPWNEKPRELMPGISQLVHFFALPVITISVVNGYRLKPIWAKSARRISAQLVINPPVVFNQSDKISQTIVKQFQENQSSAHQFNTSGKCLAHGLSEFWLYCPNCITPYTLIDKGNHTCCKACNKQWKVHTDNTLLANDTHTTVTEVWDQLLKKLRQKWQGNPTIESQYNVQLIDASLPQWRLLSSGKLEIVNHHICVNSTKLYASDINAYMLDWGNVILLKIGQKRLALKLPKTCLAIWEFAIAEAISGAKNVF